MSATICPTCRAETVAGFRLCDACGTLRVSFLMRGGSMIVGLLAFLANSARGSSYASSR